MKDMTNPYAEWFEQLRSEYGEQLRAMPLPDGLPEHLRTLINAKDEDAIQGVWQLDTFDAGPGIATAVLTGAVGLVASLTFLSLSAPDLAMTQISVDVVSTVLLLMGLALLPQLAKAESAHWRRWRDGFLAVAGGGGIAWITWLVLTRDFSSISWFFIEKSVPEGGGTNMVNVPVDPYTRGAAVRKAITDHWLPALEAFKPQMLFISAGFDAHREDDLGQLGLVEADYEWITRRLKDVADRHCNGRIVSCLEGGYALSALGRSVVAHVRVLADV
jgi:multisubunit Na+/H+ antiporter MnhB subunit